MPYTVCGNKNTNKYVIKQLYFGPYVCVWTKLYDQWPCHFLYDTYVKREAGKRYNDNMTEL